MNCYRKSADTARTPSESVRRFWSWLDRPLFDSVLVDVAWIGGVAYLVSIVIGGAMR